MVCADMHGFRAAGPFTDEMYATHEAYAMQLAAAVEDMRPILKGVEKREELKADKVEYEVITSDPSRLLVRGSSAAYVPLVCASPAHHVHCDVTLGVAG